MNADKLKLKKYYYFIEMIGIIVPVIVAWSIDLFPNSFAWISNLAIAQTSLFVVAIIHTAMLVLNDLFNKSLFFAVARYIYVLLFYIFIIITGGVNSSIIFLFFYPLVVSGVYLDVETTKRMGSLLTFLIGTLILYIPRDELTMSIISKHIVQVALFGLLAYLMHKIVIETLKQKYEKEQTTRKLVEVMEVERLKHDFLSVAQHQLRTPLAGVKWALESIKSNPDNDDTKDMLDASILRISDAINIVNDMLTTAEEGKGSLVLSKIDVDMPRLVKDICAELEYVVVKKNIKLNVSTADNLIVKADFKKIKASIINVIDNAMKYSPNGLVNVDLKKNNDNMILTVRDTGIGISRDDLPYVFDRLHRGKNAISIEPNESGVGLYTAKRIVELHGGSIEIESEVGIGTTVTVSLPL